LHSRIAERLVSLPPDVRRGLGLEIAWHCFRGGRSEEALSHLLAGADEAIRKGAPFEAELALGRDSIRKEPRIAINRVKLLVEALQEQARWTDSLVELETAQQAGVPIDHDEAFVFREWARQFTENPSEADLATTLQQLGEIVARSLHFSTRLSAARLVASICGRELATNAAAHMQPIVFALPLDHLDEHGRTAIHLARAQLCYITADTERTRRELDSATMFMASDQADSLAASRQVLLACLAIWDGRYEEALRHNIVALELSVRRGIGPTGAWTLANIAQCHGRLGNVDEQLAVAEHARDRLGARFEHFSEVQIPYWLSVGYARRAENARVLDTCARAEERLALASPGWRRIWAVYKADLLTLIGRLDDALELIRSLDHRDPYPVHFDGIFLRWHARAASSTEEVDEARRRLANATTRLHCFPMLDRAEILMAHHCLPIQSRDLMATPADQLGGVLRALPPAVTDYFRNLGFWRA
jgi:tetratricopeptide (TPR) repeat protein